MATVCGDGVVDAFLASQEEEYPVTGTSFAGSYNSGAALGTTLEWSVHKVE